MTRKDEVFSRLERVASYAMLSEEEKIAYEADMRWASEYEEEIATARREAAEEGREEGRAEGRAEGEKIARIEMAKSAISIGMETEQICKLTKLSPEEVDNLRK